MSLAEFLLDRVNREQEEATEIVYKIYESIQDNRFILPQILSWFPSSAAEWEEVDTVKEILEKEKIGEEDWIEEENLKRADQVTAAEERENHLPIVGILSFLCAAAAAATVSIGYFFTLSMEEKLVATAGTIVLVVLSALMFLYFIFNLLKNKNRVKVQDKMLLEREESVESQLISKSAFQRENMEYMKKGEYEKQEEYGNTIFLDVSSYKKEKKLYGVNKGNKYHISLEQLPCTIGKMAGNVDIVIKDSTISRIHARFTKQEDGIYVTDMNSTNGTFKNGLRLEPNETVKIECGDELRFGKMTFCYR